MKKLRIAQFVTSEVPFPVPDDFSSPWASVPIAYDISRLLSKKGHEMIFFGPQGSKSSTFQAKVINIKPGYKNPLIKELEVEDIRRREKILNLLDQYCLAQIYLEHQKKPFDIIHIHTVDRALPLAYLFPQIVFAFTLHNPTTSWRAQLYQMFQSPNQHLITISDVQQETAPNLKYLATIHNGIDLKLFPFSDYASDHLLLIGRLNQNKGVYEAIKTAKLIQKKLLLIGPKDGMEYWQTKIEPLLDKTIQHKNFVPNNKTYQYYQQAKVFLMPIMWEEPFGLVVPEANACGTPVVAFARGSMPELIKDGYNGFLVKPSDVKAMAKAVQRIYDMPEKEYLKLRQNCRKHVEENFTIEKMVDGYEKVYQQIINK